MWVVVGPHDAHSILVIEDDPTIGGAIVRGLRRSGFAVELSASGDDALDRVDSLGFAAFILDLMLPVVDGVDVLRRIRKFSHAPVLVVSARADLPQRLEVFSLGAVDFLPKPFFVEELIARLRLHLGRTDQTPTRFGGVVAAADGRQLQVNGHSVTLSNAERILLLQLIDAQQQIVSRAALAQALGDGKPVSHRTVDSYVARLRARLGDDGRRIQTVWGRGYRLVVDEA